MAATIIFAGGGSGGHLYPALAIAEQVRLVADESGAPQPRLVFVCSDRALDTKILKAADVSFVVSPARPMIATAKGLARFLRAWPRAARSARQLLRDARRLGPVQLCALGGYVAAPAVRAASRLGVSITMVNLDAIPGKANRWIAPRADRIFTAARVQRLPRRGPEWTQIPPIVRRSAATPADHDRHTCRARLGLDPRRPVLMVTSGSQGLRSVNEFLLAYVTSAEGAATLGAGRWQILHQTGRDLDADVRKAYARAKIEASVVAFTTEIANWWGAADAAVATAGAGNVAEVWCNRVPTLFLPYPHHKDEHQRFNALPLEEAGGAVIGTDRIDAEANVQTNGPALSSLLRDAARRAAMRSALDQLGPADGAARVAHALLESLETTTADPRKTA